MTTINSAIKNTVGFPRTVIFFLKFINYLLISDNAMFNEEISIFGKKANVVVFANPNKIKTLLACPIAQFARETLPSPTRNIVLHIVIFIF